MVEQIQKRDEPLILDGHKLVWHTDRVRAWLRGERIAPISIDMSLTRACNFKCEYCYGQLQDNPGKSLSREAIHRFLDDASEIGVKAVSLMSDGESICSPHFYDTITYGKSKGIDMAVATNGAIIDKEKLPEILPALSWFRFNISAGEPERYAQIHGCTVRDFHNVVEIIKESVRIKKERNLDVTIGMQMVVLPKYIDQIIPLAKLAVEFGVDYLVLKHCSDDEHGNLGVDYKKYKNPELIEKLKQAEELSTKNTFIKAKWSKISSEGKKKYDQCYAPPFFIQLSGSGLVAPCGFLFHPDYEKFHIGNIAEKSFKEIWKSDKYWDVMDLIASERFNVHTDCGTLCCHHLANEWLWDLKQGKFELNDPVGDPPQHINFI